MKSILISGLVILLFAATSARALPVAVTPTLSIDGGIPDAVVKEGHSIAIAVVSNFGPGATVNEVLTLTITGINSSWGSFSSPIGSYNPTTGIWTVTLAPGQNLNTNLTFTPVPLSDADLTVTTTATAFEPATSTTAATTNILTVVVDAVAHAPIVTSSGYIGNEDTMLPVNFSATIGNPTGSESLASWINFSGVPAGFTFNHGTNSGGGVWNIALSDLATLQITSPLHFVGTVNLTAVANEYVSTLSGQEIDFSDNSATTTNNILETWLSTAPVLNIALTGAAARTNASGNFVIASSPGVGIDPRFVAAADINGDGKMDLISANYGDNTLTVLTNTGGGIFGSNASYTVGKSPWWVAAADINGDGKVDLISANSGTNTLTVLTNNGNGIFGSNATYIVGNLPFSVVVVTNIDGLGHMALVSANHGLGNGNTLTVLTNNGSGVFGSNATYTVGGDPYSVTAVDVNGDGFVDLISANSGGGSTLSTVLTNNGYGTFVYDAAINNIGIADYVVPADVNGDGKVDLIAVGGAFSMTIYTNNGNEGFTYSSTFALSDNPVSAVAVDVNDDDRVDLIKADPAFNKLTVLENNGRGVFSTNATYIVGNDPWYIAAADVNGDGFVDLITANVANTLTVLTNSATTVTNVFNNAIITWTTNLTGYGLQQNSNLATANWVNVTNVPMVTNGYDQVQLPVAGISFFRLLHP